MTSLGMKGYCRRNRQRELSTCWVIKAPDTCLRVAQNRRSGEGNVYKILLDVSEKLAHTEVINLCKESTNSKRNSTVVQSKA